MKMPYENTQILLEILIEASQKYQKDIDDISTEYGSIKIDIPTNIGSHLLAKRDTTIWLIEQIKNGTVEF